jgi:heme exporter protein B
MRSYPFLSQFKRDFSIAYRHRLESLNPIVFFILVILLFPLAITSDAKLLALIGPGIIWITSLLANMLSVETLFMSDYEDGSLEQIVISPYPLVLLVYGKLFAHWLFTAVPIIVVSLIAAKLFFIEKQSIMIVFLSLLLGTPVLTMLGGIGSALTLGLKNRGVLVFLLIVPLYLPILIFGAGAVNDAAMNLPVTGHLLFLAALLVLSLTFAPLIMSAAIKISLE